MATMRGRQNGPTPAHYIEWFTWTDSDAFTSTYFEPSFPSVDAARAAWTRCRRAVWLQTVRFDIPRAAEIFDGLTLTSRAVVFNSWNHVHFALDPVLTALTTDRASLLAFEAARQPGRSATASTYSGPTCVKWNVRRAT